MLTSPPNRSTGTQDISVESDSPFRASNTLPESSDPRVSFTLPSNVQPSRADCFDQLFVSHFIESFGHLKEPDPGVPSPVWLDELPIILYSPVPSLVKFSIRAGSMLSYGTQAQDISIQTESHRWYARSLRDLRSLLQRSVSPQERATLLTEDVLCAVVMLIHFETMAGTSPTAWVQHVEGAAVILEARGPENCRLGFMNQLFRHVRLQATLAAIAQSKTPHFGSPRWMSIPFDVNPKSVFDDFVDTLLLLTQCLFVAEELIEHRDATSIQMEELKALVELTTSRIDSLRSHSVFSLRSTDGSPNMPPGVALESMDPFHRIQVEHPGEDSYPNIGRVSLKALYDAACVMILSLSSLVLEAADTYRERIRRHAQSIISANELINGNTNGIIDRGSIMMLFPLTISISSEQQICLPSEYREEGISSSIRDLTERGNAGTLRAPLYPSKSTSEDFLEGINSPNYVTSVQQVLR
ncbi:uncharacterized protein ATNIH1004_008155 [Aspergillus tanneri]|uniref:Transcription factor domain-containing protein n=1 Tax=Aspergillus tanneri TaxID=1220188 RepID=A0A5M9MHL4_9EURO|nr:uncharacterized protein ATNIH1004_008155 [Aspergillus tanneri]KAA8643959.1 hypothetical protein ATNIH1004_008155 [Aspergillus tanneri]